jgi:FKBP-type peptidyl-prolyl cis-trans isomerase 2
VRRLATLLAVCALLACSRGPRAARVGDRVTVHYSAFVDGALFETSRDGKPAELVLGGGGLPPPVERALVGRRAGDEVDLTVPDAYGPRDAAKIEVLPLSAFAGLKPQPAVGQLVLGTRGEEAAKARVAKLEGGKVWLDFNHRLAGKPVGFRVSVLAVAAP